MTIKLQDFNNAILKSGGTFAGLNRYECSRGFLSDVALRVGESYGNQLRNALIESQHDLMIEDEFGQAIPDEYRMSIVGQKCRATLDEVVNAFDEQRASWQSSLDGTQPQRKRSTIPLAETLGKVEVAQINKDGTGINIRCVVRHTERERNGYAEHNAKIAQTSKKIEPKSGKARVKAWLRRRYMSSKTFTLKPDNFSRFDMAGMSLKPSDISPMLDEWRQQQTA